VNRRELLTGIVSTVPIGLAGCLDLFDTWTPDDLTAVAPSPGRVHFGGCCISPSGPRPRTQQTILTDRSTAERRLRTGETLSELIDEPDFDRASLLAIVVAAGPSEVWLGHQDIARLDNGLRVSVVVQSPDDPVGDDASVHSLLVRLIDEQLGVSDRIVIAVNQQETGTVTPQGSVSVTLDPNG
jgi:hypothetical protein